MRLAPLFHNTGSCADSTCDTDRFMALLPSTQLCCWLRQVCIHCGAWMHVVYSTSSLHACIHVHLCLWMHLLWPMDVFVFEKRPYGLQNVLADNSSSGFEIGKAGFCATGKMRWRTRGGKKRKDWQLTLHICCWNCRIRRDRFQLVGFISF